MMSIEKKLNLLIKRISGYLLDVLITPSRIKRSFYGETFAALSLLKLDVQYKNAAKDFLRLYKKKNKDDPEFHWEFNNYALQQMDKKFVDDVLGEDHQIDRFKYTDCTNWILLRCLCQLTNGRDKDLCLREVDDRLDKMITTYGLIKDDEGVLSFQYHMFSAVLLYGFYEKTDDEKYKDIFIKAVRFLENFIFPNGCSIYIGRGQEQIFGYAVVLYGLALAYKITKDDKHIYYLDKVLNYVISFLDKDDRKVPLPLTLNHEETDSEERLSIDDIRHPGWYAYNNYLDYIAFFEYYAIMTYQCLKAYDHDKIMFIPEDKVYYDGDHLVYRKKDHMMVLAKGGGYWTNDQQFPIIYHNGEIITPCCGGEQFGSDLYSQRSLPLPYARSSGSNVGKGNKIKGAIKRILGKDRGFVFLNEDTEIQFDRKKDDEFEMIFDNRYLKLVRRFFIDTGSIYISDKLMVKGKKIAKIWFINVPLFDGAKQFGEKSIKIRNGASIHFSHNVFANGALGTKACAMGKITLYSACKEVSSGDEIESWMMILLDKDKGSHALWKLKEQKDGKCKEEKDVDG